jgi:hypothetical protein
MKHSNTQQHGESHNTERKKQDTKEHIQYDPFHMKINIRQNDISVKGGKHRKQSKAMVTRKVRGVIPFREKGKGSVAPYTICRMLVVF